MLDLQPRVHLHEPELAVLEQELDGAGADVADCLRRLDRGFAHGRAQLRVHRRGGRFLEQLLVAALDRALALAEVDAVAVRIREDLHLDVARLVQGLFHEHSPVAEGMLGFGLRALQRGRQVVPGANKTHASPATSRERLDHHRKLGIFFVGRQHRHAGFGGELLRIRLVAHGADRGRGRTDPDAACFLHRCRELFVLREKPVARMNRITLGFEN